MRKVFFRFLVIATCIPISLTVCKPRDFPLHQKQEARFSQVSQHDEFLDVTIVSDNSFIVGGRNYTRSEFLNNLSKILEIRKVENVFICIRPQDGVSFGSIQGLVDETSSVGINRISIVHELKVSLSKRTR